VGRRSPSEARNTSASCRLNGRNARAVVLPSPRNSAEQFVDKQRALVVLFGHDRFLSNGSTDRVWSFRFDETSRCGHALTGHTLHLMVSSLDGHRSHFSRDRTAVYSTSGISKSLFGEELDETGGDGGGIPARQIVARMWYRHRVDFWNALLQ
jgi:hypothetical protein